MGRDNPQAPRLLIAADDSDATTRAIAYVGETLGGRSDPRIRLYHRLPPLPPELRDHGGSEHPERELELEQAQGRRIAEWVRDLEARMRPVLERHRDALAATGVPTDAVELVFDEDVAPGEALGDALRRAARAHGCDTIVIAREHLSGMQEWFTRHASDELARHPEGFAIWIVD